MLNKLVKILIIGATFFFLTIIQNSFLNVFTDFNFIILLVLLINILDDPKSYFGLWSAFFAGFFLDMTSTQYFGLWMLILVFSSLIIKWILNNFFKISHVSFFPEI
jgi:rod shape-determining protein MreD